MRRDLRDIVERVRTHARTENFRLTRHALEEMVEEAISLREVLEVIGSAEVLENYPEHRRGPCCLLCGKTEAGRPLHIVATTMRPELIIITVYEPKAPKWATPEVRSRRK